MNATPAATPDLPRFVDIDVDGRRLSIEYAWIAPERVNAPLVVFLHEGLGSLSMWKDFPQRLCDAVQVRGLVYSRPPNGRSSPRRRDEPFAVDYLNQHALRALPQLLPALGVRPAQRPWLFGHSDGASIALLHAAQFPAAIGGVVVMAPHLFVEDISVQSIAATRQSYLETDMRERLARYHDDVDAAFWAWNDIWLDPAFRRWNIEAEVSRIECPVLALQGLEDQYGTMQQLLSIAHRLPAARIVELPDCRHSPHRDQPERVIEETMRFIEGFRGVGGLSNGSRQRAVS